jgi:hypothetical protein
MTDNIQLTAESFTVHAREKISTGDYENAACHVTIEGSVDGATELDADTRVELKARLLAVQKEAQASVRRTVENRIREPGHEDWGVYNDDS